MKKSLFAVLAFSLLSLSAVSPSYSQATGEKISGKIGVLEFATSLPAGWKAGMEAEKKANEILESEAVKPKASFAAMFGSKGPIIYATWSVFPEGFAVTAASIVGGVSESTFPSEWKMVPSELKLDTKMLPNRIEYAYARILGTGNGKQFGGAAGIKTVAIWIDIPVAYQDGDKVSGGMASLYLRGSEADFKGASKIGAEKFLMAIAESLKLVDAEPVPIDVLVASSKNKRQKQEAPAGSDGRSESLPEMPLSQATVVINAQDSSSAQMLAACETVRQHMMWRQRPGFKSVNPELRRLDSICESRLERTILSARIQAELSETAKLESYLAPMYESAVKAGPSAWCEFLYYVDSIWEDNKFKRPDKDQCPRRSRLK